LSTRHPNTSNGKDRGHQHDYASVANLFLPALPLHYATINSTRIHATISDFMSATAAEQNHLNGHSGFLLAVFIFVSAFVIWPIRIPIPKSIQRVGLSVAKAIRIIEPEEYQKLKTANLSFPISLQTAPVIGVVLLLATTTIHGSTIKLGIKGDENVKPYDVLVLFISLVGKHPSKNFHNRLNR
jgi:hypothetical protein